MDIACLFVKRKHLMDSPAELVCAWDGWSIEENFEGWETACREALESIGEDLGAHRYVNLKVPDAPIEDLFREYVTVEVKKVSEIDSPEAI